jgi:SHS2 domain-containing protein
VTAPSLEILFKTAAAALFDLLATRHDETPAPIEVEREIRVAGADREELLVRWLSELLYLHDAEGLIFHAFEITDLQDGHLAGRVTGERYDPERHRPGTEIKAVTYHQVLVQREGDLWKARLVFDV